MLWADLHGTLFARRETRKTLPLPPTVTVIANRPVLWLDFRRVGHCLFKFGQRI